MKDLYLNTLRDTLTGEAYGDWRYPHAWWNRIAERFGWRVFRATSQFQRHEGRVWPMTALTMVGTKRLDNIRHCLEICDRDRIPGAFVECGVWRGGACIYAAGVIAVSGSQRQVIACDSFRGLPKPVCAADWSEPVHLHKDSSVLAVSKEEVWKNFCRFHLGNDNVQLVEGWFSQTLRTLPCDRIAVLRADGDMYESTRDILKLYERVSPGGFVIIDDYGDVEGCRKAVNEFLARHGEIGIYWIDCASIYWRVP